MSILYKCRHCGQNIGRIDEKIIDTSLLGFDHLTQQDRIEMIHYQDNGDIHIQITCEDCETSLVENPQYHELDFFIQ